MGCPRSVKFKHMDSFKEKLKCNFDLWVGNNCLKDATSWGW